jgi:hypothetical protein
VTLSAIAAVVIWPAGRSSPSSAAVASGMRSTRSRERSWLGRLRGVSWSVLFVTANWSGLGAGFTGKGRV